MTKFETAPRAAGGIARIMNPVSRFGPRIMLAPQEDGSPTPEETAAAEKAAADAKAAADKAAADKAEADRIAARKAEDEKKSKEDLAAERDKLLRETMDRKAKLKEREEELARQAAELKRFEGIDPDAVKKLLEEKKTAEQIEAEKRGEFDRVKQMMADDHAKQTKALQDRIDALTAEHSVKDKTIDKLTLGNDFATSEFITKELVLSPDKTRVIYGDHFEVKDGKTIAYDKPKSAKDRTELTGADGKPLNFEDAIKHIVNLDPDKDRMLKSKIAPGSGSSTTTGTVEKKADEVKGVYGVGRIAAALAKKAAQK